VEARDGLVVLNGRVGTDGERLIAEHVARTTCSSTPRAARRAPRRSTSSW
jgi:hypothetical protein